MRSYWLAFWVFVLEFQNFTIRLHLGNIVGQDWSTVDSGVVQLVLNVCIGLFIDIFVHLLTWLNWVVIIGSNLWWRDYQICFFIDWSFTFELLVSCSHFEFLGLSLDFINWWKVAVGAAWCHDWSCICITWCSIFNSMFAEKIIHSFVFWVLLLGELGSRHGVHWVRFAQIATSSIFMLLLLLPDLWLRDSTRCVWSTLRHINWDTTCWHCF